jgi:hypothetical protein
VPAAQPLSDAVGARVADEPNDGGPAAEGDLLGDAPLDMLAVGVCVPVAELLGDAPLDRLAVGVCVRMGELPRELEGNPTGKQTAEPLVEVVPIGQAVQALLPAFAANVP